MVKRGFSLVELLIAIVLIVTALVPLLQAMGSALFVSTGSETESAALALAVSRMEQLKALSYAAITAEARTALSGSAGLQRAVAVSSPAVDLKQVTVTVFWPTVVSAESAVTLETYVANF
jgi:prepilin-type N-terminal cleavage/methylation domain-containing protein